VTLDFRVDDFMGRLKPLDVEAVLAGATPLTALATDVESGHAALLRDFTSGVELRAALRAGATMPVVNPGPYAIRGRRYFDASLGEPIPLQAANPQSGTLERVQRLLEHPAFAWRNPNKVRALVGAFARANRPGFHRVDGAGYRLVGEAVRTLDAINPQIASRLTATFNAWRRLEPVRQGLMRIELERLAATPGLSNDAREIVARALA